MPKLEDPSGNSVPRHLKEYFAGTGGAAPKPQEDVEPASANAPSSPTVMGGSDEITLLQMQIAEKDEAIFHAVLSASNLKQELEDVKAELAQAYVEPNSSAALPAPLKDHPLSLETQAEVNRQRQEWMRIQKGLEREHSLRKAELLKVRGQWYQTQQQLEQESRARRMEGAQSSAKIATIERDLSAANGVISNAYRNEGSPNLKRGLVALLAVIMFLVVAGGVWAQFSPRRIVATTDARPSMTPMPARTVAEPVRSGPSQTAFSGSLGRLNEALSSFGARSPEDVLREVRVKSGDPSICAFRWNGGQPALIFGKEGIRHTLAESLGGCAAAVEKFRP